MRLNSPGWQTVVFVLFLAVAQAALHISLLTRGVEYVTGSLTIDDTYYYLQTAWNAKQFGFVTFDGIHSTNGVQLLWFLVILVIAFLAQTKMVLLFATLVVSFILNGLCYLSILEIGITLKRPSLTLILASLWFLQSLPFRIYSMGMENSLHALVLWCAIWQSLVFLIRVHRGAQPNYWLLTIILILNAWTRLDAALLSAVLYVYCMASWAYAFRSDLSLFWQRHYRAIAGSSLFAGAALVAQLAAFRLMGGSFLPVSALVKTSGGGRGLGFEAGEKFVEVLLLGLPPILQGRLPSVALVALSAFGLLLVIGLLRPIANYSLELRALAGLWRWLLVTELAYHLYIAVSGVKYMPYFVWYRSPSFIFWIITISLVALYLLERVKLAGRPLARLTWPAISVSLLAFGAATYLFVRSVDFTSPLYNARYQAALWISENSAPGTVFAAWNTGQLGFYSDRTFINLDGVINDVDYLERVLHGSVPLIDYLNENAVEYIVDYATYATLPNFPVVRSFPVHDGSGRSIQFWQISTRVSTTP